MRIGKNLIRYRCAKGWSQEDLAHEVGMSQSNYSKIESDKQTAAIDRKNDGRVSRTFPFRPGD